ncbi:hypothetical protein GCM10017752_35350 [Streptomyces roseoviridis]
MKLPSRDVMARQADEKLETSRIRLPRRVVENPLRQVAKRILMALGVMTVTVLLVYLDREGITTTPMRRSTSSTASTTRPSPSPPPATATSSRTAIRRDW